MTEEIKIPSLGESITEATISALLVKEGDIVKRDQEILELETEKVNQVLFAPESGKISWSVQEGDAVSIGAVVGKVDTSVKGESAPPPQKEAPKKEEAKPAASPQQTGGIRQFAKDYAASLNEAPAKTQVEKTVEASTPSKAPSLPPPPAQESSSAGKDRREPMSKIRKTTAKRLVEAKQNMAQLTTFNEVNMSAVVNLRKKYKEKFEKEHGVKLGFMSFFVKACVAALQEFPAINAYIDIISVKFVVQK